MQKIMFKGDVAVFYLMIFDLSEWPQTWKTWNTQGFLQTWKTQGILREFCGTSGKNCNKESIFSYHSNICVKQLLTG